MISGVEQGSEPAPVKSKRGGRRPGAGRPVKGTVRPPKSKPPRKSNPIAAIQTAYHALAIEDRAELAKRAREHAPMCIDVLAEIARDPEAPAPARTTAANSLLDRGYGKAVGDAAPAPSVVNVAIDNRSVNVLQLTPAATAIFEEARRMILLEQKGDDDAS